VCGLLVGSFLNVCIARLPRGESIAFPGSHCPQCGAPVRAWQNIPLLSYALLRGRCSHCQARISPRYPAVEAGYACLATASVALWGWTAHGLEAAVLSFFLLGLLVTDVETMLLPDALTLPGTALGIAAAALIGGQAWLASAAWALLVAAGAAGVLALVSLLYWLVRRREGLGRGDIKLMALMGAWLGWEQTAVAFTLGVVAAALWGVVLLLRHGREEEPGALRLPLGSFLCGGALASLFAGRALLGWYLGLFR
jgi:leader peptidase (prepilin peptidase) / N-methyltransferase